ncbi:MAG: family 10 glycosylhydrolase [Candidatus Omnitrophica bacterium]|nr:family 10 glycosylhydrolase [Candidatus Omnitrophota bacterium]MDD5652771.1 family 10 glycosylhydrolase [Candidatus Omnitrophota bacterium]
MIKKALLFFVLFYSFLHPVFAQPKETSRGVWVTVFSQKKALYSKKAALELINLCKEAKINEIYLQVYQSGKAYYNSVILDQSKYREMLQKDQADPIDFLLKQAKENNIKVFAWVNLLSLGQNTDADIVKKFGKGILTRDQYLRPSGKEKPLESDKYYLREDQYFLEPGDPRVARFLIAIVEEISKRYPLFSGFHLDYVRYPMTVPFIPSSKFNKFGLSYGYGKKNLEHFSSLAGIDPLNGLKTDKQCLEWDNWRRQQVSSLVRRISKHIKLQNPQMLVSAAVVPSAERAYASLFQDWPLWLEEGALDYVVLMNYTPDEQLTKEMVRSALAQRQKGRVFVGMGLFLMKDSLSIFQEQYEIVRGLNPDGIAIFSCDDLTPEVVSYLAKTF